MFEIKHGKKSLQKQYQTLLVTAHPLSCMTFAMIAMKPYKVIMF
jgi:hypothetical protein